MPKRRSARLLEKEEQFMRKPAKSPSSRHETDEPLMQNSFIFDATIRDVLPKIINNLNPCSFVRLARTCKEVRRICFKNKDIQIPCWSGRMHYSEVIINSIAPASWRLQVNFRENSTDNEFVKKLSRMPFIYHVQNLLLTSEVNDSLLMEIRNYFSKFPRVVIRCISGIQAVDSCDGLIEFIKDFNVRNVWNLQAEVPLEALSFLTQNMQSLGYDGYVPEDVILSATSKHLNLPNAAISLSTFKELVKKFQSGLIGRSTIGLEWDYDNEDDVDLFVKACSEIMEVVHVEDIDEPDMKPAVIYIDSTYPYEQYFSLIKSDGSIGVFCIEWNKIVFR